MKIFYWHKVDAETGGFKLQFTDAFLSQSDLFRMDVLQDIRNFIDEEYEKAAGELRSHLEKVAPK